MTMVEEKPAYLVGEVDFRKTTQLRPYETDTFSHRVQYLIDPDGSSDENLSRAREASLEAKSWVYDVLGIDTELSDSGIPMEIMQRAFPDAVVETAAPTQPEASASSVAAEPPYDPTVLRKPRAQMNDIEKAQAAANTQWAKDRYDAFPHEFYDNRNDKPKPSSPDFKHKSSGVAFWID